MARVAGALALATAIAVSGGCGHARQAAAPPVLPAQPTIQPAPTAEPEADEDGLYLSGVGAWRKNLPLAGTAWAWEGSIDGEDFKGLSQEAEYRLEFKPHGWFDFQADCRRGAGIYETNGQRIAFAVLKVGHAACRPGSQADDFVGALEAAKSFRLADAKLYFELKREGKTMVFVLKP
ncbi:MAG: META domain-containing protein [Candidatus Methylumidiphilus sp.]